MRYKGSCHCGKIAFEVEGELKEVLDCNCSICRRKGALLWAVPRGKLSLKTPESNLSDYQFNKHFIHHRFCAACGMHPFAEGKNRSGEPMAMINVRCLEEVDLGRLKVMPFDGASL
jgi:hypothetical protein